MSNIKVAYEDIKKFEPMIEYFLKKYVIKRWTSASLFKDHGDVFLGSTGMTMNDIRSLMLTEIISVLGKYDPAKKASKCTLVYTHLNNRTISLVKKLCGVKYGYGKTIYDIDSMDDWSENEWSLSSRRASSSF